MNFLPWLCAVGKQKGWFQPLILWHRWSHGFFLKEDTLARWEVLGQQYKGGQLAKKGRSSLVGRLPFTLSSCLPSLVISTTYSWSYIRLSHFWRPARYTKTQEAQSSNLSFAQGRDSLVRVGFVSWSQDTLPACSSISEMYFLTWTGKKFLEGTKKIKPYVFSLKKVTFLSSIQRIQLHANDMILKCWNSPVLQLIETQQYCESFTQASLHHTNPIVYHCTYKTSKSQLVALWALWGKGHGCATHK